MDNRSSTDILIFDQRLKEEKEYWVKKLSQVRDRERADLPPVRQMSRASSPNWQTYTFVLPAELCDKIQSLAKGSPLLTYTILLAAVKICLYKYTGNEIIVVGSPVQQQDTLSHTPDLLAVFNRMEKHVSFRQLLVNIRKDLVEAYKRQDYPFSYLMHDLGLDGEHYPCALLAVVVALEGLHGELPPQNNETTLTFAWRDQSLQARISFDSNAHSQEQVVSFANHLQTLLAKAFDAPQSTIDELEILTESERHVQLHNWNHTERVPRQERCVHQFIEAQARRVPDAIAVVYEDDYISYAELELRAGQLAAHLRLLGVGPDKTVGLCVERSVGMVIGMLGILKAGGAYVPLDTANPQDRLRFMIEDARVSVVVTGELQREWFSSLPLQIVSLPLITSILEEQTGDAPVSPDNLAYVIYTSGSSGQPKGVAIEHRQVAHYLYGILERLEDGLEEIRSFASVSTVAADLGNTSLFAALCTGRSLHVISEKRALDPTAFTTYMRQRSIDCLKIVPPHLEMLLLSTNPADALPGQWLILGGDVVQGAFVEKLRQLNPACRVMNHYGPTETTVGVLTFPAENKQSGESVALGRPLPNVDVYILDDFLRPVPAGVPGELYIGGASVGRGYFAQPALTGERFLPDPFSTAQGARLYRTGDRAFYQSDGNIQFAGRVDEQIKVRGFRVEPSEIEAQLRRHPAVKDVIVGVDSQDSTGQPQIVAYVVPERSSAPTVSGKPRYRLPNELVIMHLNKNETDYLYEEIFEKKAYIKHGIHVAPGDCVFDVGANIGLFTLFINRLCPEVILYSFEPVPEIFALLEQNVMLYNVHGEIFNLGVSDTENVAPLTYFPKFSILSSLAADPVLEKEFVKTYIQNQQQDGEVTEQILQQAERVLEERLQSIEREVHLKTLSQIIKENHVERIALLKINVEKNEVAVLRGIQAEDWSRICQIVLEVDSKEHLDIITGMLEEQGYRVVVEQDTLLQNTERYYLYALREEEGNREQNTSALLEKAEPALTTQILKSFLSDKLPAYMLPTHIVLLEAFPLTANGKIDRRELPAAESLAATGEQLTVLPRTSTEEVLAGIWSGLFHLEQASIQDNFFELGGHSLLAAQLVYRVRDILKADITVGDVFEHPTLTALAEVIDRSGINEAQILPLQPQPRGERIPLAFGQQRLWFLNQLAPDSSFYSTHAALRLTGPLSIHILERSISEVIRRHEILRTTFPTQDGQPVQRIAPPGPVMLPVADISRLTSEARAEILQQLLDSGTRSSFDLARGPLISGYLIRLNREEHVLLMSVHHTIFDAWSRGIFLKEVEALYRAFRAGELTQVDADAILPELRVQYTDFTRWQQVWLQHKAQEHLNYWKSKLADSTQLELPTDRPRPAVQTFRGASERFEVSPALTAALIELSRQEGTSLFMTLMATFQTLLYRYTGQIDISISTGASNRNHADLEKLIGFFVNTLILRADLSGNPTFREVLGRVRGVALEAYAHQDVPFDLVIGQLRPERDLSYNPLFQVALILQNAPRPAPAMSEITVEFLKLKQLSSKVDLTLNIQERAGRLLGSLEYNTDLFENLTIVRMLNHFQRLLEGIVADPAWPIATLPMLMPAEQERFLVAQEYLVEEDAPFRPFHQLFEAQVERTPEAVALRCGEEQLTYATLNRRANMLARYLLSLDICPEEPVGVFCEPTSDMIVALLAIFKAGAAYVPLDPAYPPERLAFMMTDTGMKIIVAPSALPEHMAIVTGTRVLELDTLQDQIAAYSDQNVALDLAPAHLAYVIHTSGSTGKPKGVLVQHQGLSNLILSQIREWGVRPESRVLQFASLSFDASLSEIGMALLAGATLHLRENNVLLLGSELVQCLQHEQITHVTLPPSILATLPVQPLPALSTLIVAGEECPVSLAARWAPGRHLFNAYGPTEATIGACFAEYTPNTSLLPIYSKRFSHTQLFLLDAYLQPVPTGVVGAIYIGGQGLARGYCGRPDLTAEQFIPHPFSQLSGERLYKTGDRARYLPNGEIEYIGRSDYQIKIRGFRVEPAEIETVLTGHPAIHEAVVIMREDEPGKQRLVAYVVFKPEQSASFYEIYTFLKQHLPAYLIPSALVPLTNLQLTPNGKIDRRALPAPEFDRPVERDQEAFVAPRSEIEEALVRIWSEVLAVEQVSIYDDFFELGGDSLLSFEVLSRVNKTFSVDIAIQSLFESTTVADLARAITEILA